MTSVELGTHLRERFAGLKEKHPSQQALAMSWYEQHGDKKLGSGTVESRLSELFNGRLDGLKFFFGQRDRSTVLLRLLGVSPSEAGQIYASAELALAGQLDARTLIDLRAMTDAEVQLACKWIESDVLSHAGLLPMVLLVLPGQAKQIPRGFDDYRDKDHLTWTEEIGKAVERATVLLAPTPWALGPDRQIWPWQKWAQLGFVGGKVQLDPQDGLEQLATRGGLATPTLVECDLAGIGAEADPVGAAKWLEAQGDHWRGAAERLLACADPKATAAVAPSVRLALAARLGVVAAATAAEVEEQEIALVAQEIGAGAIENWSEGELKKRLEKARTRPLAPVVARVGGCLHVINWPACAGRESGGRLVVHEVVAPVPAIDAVRARLGELSPVEFQFADDLDALVTELVAQGHDRLAVRHACATLYLRGELAATCGATVSEGLAPETANEHDRELALAVLGSRYTPARLFAAGEAVGAEDPNEDLAVPMPGGRVVLREQTEFKLCQWRANDELRSPPGRYGVANPWYHLLQGLLEGATWLDAFENWAQQAGKRQGPVRTDGPQPHQVQVDWAEVDSFCSLLKVNLDRALKAGHWHEVDQRTYLAPLGSGICAQVAVTDTSRGTDRLIVSASGKTGSVFPNKRTITSATRALPLIAGDANCGPRVLNQVTFAAGKVHLTVNFHADPFTASSAQAWPAVVTKVETDAAQARRDRDDD